MKLTMRQLFYIMLVVTAVSTIIHHFYQQEVRDTVITLRLSNDDIYKLQSNEVLGFLGRIRFFGGILLAVIASIRFRKYPLLILFFAALYLVVLNMNISIIFDHLLGVPYPYNTCLRNNGLNYSSYCYYIDQGKYSIQDKFSYSIMTPISGMFLGFSVSFIVSVIAYIFQWVVKLKRRASPDDSVVID